MGSRSIKNIKKQCVFNLTNESVREFWKKEFANYSPRLKVESTIPISNKLSGFLANPTIHRILCSAKTNIKLRSIMDNQEVLLVNLAKGKIGSESTNLLGSLLLHSIGLAAYSRTNIEESERKFFPVHVDEAYNFLTLSLTNSIPEVRKYAVSYTLVGHIFNKCRQNYEKLFSGMLAQSSYFEQALQMRFSWRKNLSIYFLRPIS